ncbi:MAG: hypothetical protein IJ511_03245 [Bacteroides sp.]|nr:hypothetical protein [Bacteroides sp.]
MLLLLCLAWPAALHGQSVEQLCLTDYRLDSLRTKELRLEIDNVTFFKDNEFGGSVMKGYSLPGLWLAPKLAYQPLPHLKIELGAYALWYSGAYKFPNYAYQDIAEWKGSQFQRGAHILPHFRGHLQLGDFNLVLGNLYGASNHRLILPLYSPELNLTADPESGFQMLYDTRNFHLDAWINWQSFIFEMDTHQEAFTVGLSTKWQLNRPDAPLHTYLQLQGTLQHRGGEQDDKSQVNTLANAALGAGIVWNTPGRLFRTLTLEADALGYYQQAGTLWPYDSGAAFYGKAELQFRRYFHLQAGYFVGRHFISLLGLPYFGSVSTKHEGALFDSHPQTWHFAFDYTRTFGKHYAFGAKAEAFLANPGPMTLPDGTLQPTGNNLNFSFGVYLRLNPSFLLKKIK